MTSTPNITNRLLEPDVALKLIDTIEEKILSLEFMPHRCPERRIGAYGGKGYRQLQVKNYTVTAVTVWYASSQF